LVQLRSVESGQTLFLGTTNWSTNSFTSLPVNNFPIGYAFLTLFVNGTPSLSALTLISTNQAPQIITQPFSQSALLNSNVTFTVEAVGVAPLAYQWFFGSNIVAKATNTSFTITNAQSTNAGNYQV